MKTAFLRKRLNTSILATQPNTYTKPRIDKSHARTKSHINERTNSAKNDGVKNNGVKKR